MTTVVRLDGVTLPEVGAPPISSFSIPSLPSASGLVGLYAFGGDREASARNHAVPSAPLTARGNPEMVNSGVRISGASGFNTGMSPMPNVTTFAVVRVPAPQSIAEGQMLLATYIQGGDISGDSFGITFSAGVPAFAIYASTSAGAGTIIARANISGDVRVGEYALVVARTRATGEGRIWLRQPGVLVANPEGPPMTRAIADREPSIGNRYGTSTNFTGEVDLNFMAVYSRALSDPEVESAITEIVGHYNQIGIAL